MATAGGITISPAAPQDMQQVQQLARSIWPAAYASILRPEQVQNMLERIYSLDNLRQEVEKGHRFFLAWEAAQPLGYASSYKDDNTVWVKKLYVLPGQQGKGVGTRLMRAAVAAHLPALQVSLLVNNGNTPAMAYYEHSGFIRSGETPVQMGDYHFTDYIYTCPVTNIVKA